MNSGGTHIERVVGAWHRAQHTAGDHQMRGFFPSEVLPALLLESEQQRVIEQSLSNWVKSGQGCLVLTSLGGGEQVSQG